MNFVFYDTETTGTNTSFDQILQFAAIRTDSNFDELERFEIRCRLLPHVVPAPAALTTTGVRPEMLMDSSLPSHYEAMCQIADRLDGWSPAIFFGYNSMNFDERLLRQAFYQNLKPTYLTNTNGNSRGDILKLVDATIALAPNTLVTPIANKGRVSRKLDRLAPANGFDHSNAHDALADVEATIYLARLLRSRRPELWDALIATARKRSTLDVLWSGSALATVETFYGRHTIRPIAACGSNPDNPAQVVALDLRSNPEDFVDLSVDDLLAVMRQRGSPFRAIPANSQPILVPLDQTTAALINDLPAPSVIMSRSAQIQRRLDFQDRVGEAMALRYPHKPQSPYVEEQIFDSFPRSSDVRLAVQFHKIPWETRRGLLEQITDGRIRELGLRLLGLEAPENLSDKELGEFRTWIDGRKFGARQTAGIRTVEHALSECDDQMESASLAQQNQLKAIRAWLVDQLQGRQETNPQRHTPVA